MLRKEGYKFLWRPSRERDTSRRKWYLDTYVTLKKKTQLFHIKTPGATFSVKKKREKNASWKKKATKSSLLKKTSQKTAKGPQTAGNPGAIEKEKAVSCDGFIDQPPESRPRSPKKRPPKKVERKKPRGKMVAWHFKILFLGGRGEGCCLYFQELCYRDGLLVLSKWIDEPLSSLFTSRGW